MGMPQHSARPVAAGAKRHRRGAALLAIALCLLLNPLAAASPPDPGWIAGLYDADDFDDAVIRIGLAATACDAFSTPWLALDALVHPLIPSRARPLVRRSGPPSRGRAPPLV